MVSKTILQQKDRNKTKRNHKIKKKKQQKCQLQEKAPLIIWGAATHMKMVSVCRNQSKAKFEKQSRKKKYSNFHFAAVLMIYCTWLWLLVLGRVKQQKLLIMSSFNRYHLLFLDVWIRPVTQYVCMKKKK